MHSSRMRTARSLTVSRSICRGGGLSALGGVPAQGVYLRGGACPGIPPLCTEFLTHATENITLPQTSFAGGKYFT